MPDLSGNPALDVAIGLSFVFLLFSVLCSAVQEALAGIFDLRARRLVAGLKNLLEDNGGAGIAGAPKPIPPQSEAAAEGGTTAPTLVDDLLGHGLIRAQYQGSRYLLDGRRGPSYLPSRAFSLALLDLVAPDPDAPSLHTTIAENPDIPAGTKHALLSLVNAAGNERDKFRTQVEQWFDGAMDRVSGWYKRRSQLIICVIALVVAVGLNVNTIAIADRLAHDDAVRSAVVAQAVKLDVPADNPIDATVKRIKEVEDLGLPIGWGKQHGDPVKADLGDHFLRTAGGWLLTFLALSLGGPFWFDALGRLSRLRSSGPAPTDAATR